MENILNVKNVTKSFGDYKASNDISFNVEKGKIFGLLGPNGAGKTTMIRMLTNIYVPDSGSITLFGNPVGPDQQNNIGYLPEERGLYKKMKVLDQLVYFGQLKGMSKKTALDSARLWLVKLDAADYANKKVQDLSKGMSQKVQFVASLLHNPKFLILDEPFSGFDPINADLFKDIVIELRKNGATIILSTHIMHQVEQLCDDICLINKGKLLLSGNVREIKKSYGKNTININFEGSKDFLNNLSNIEVINSTDSSAEFKLLDLNQSPNSILSEIMKFVQIYKFEIDEPSLNEIFIDVVTKANGEQNEIKF
ncbi:MAG: ATP-binding cassette domain-containing protein [Candidatus Kapabacteria bacterium]|nr:ATP-binding cassette domain-containing protein [Candidatus Kapabacteria bacterium]